MNITALEAQMVKHLPTMRETKVQYLGWEDPLEKEMATHSSNLAWKIPWMEATVHGVAKGWTQLNDFTFTFNMNILYAIHYFLYKQSYWL